MSKAEFKGSPSSLNFCMAFARYYPPPPPAFAELAAKKLAERNESRPSSQGTDLFRTHLQLGVSLNRHFQRAFDFWLWKNRTFCLAENKRGPQKRDSNIKKGSRFWGRAMAMAVHTYSCHKSLWSKCMGVQPKPVACQSSSNQTNLKRTPMAVVRLFPYLVHPYFFRPVRVPGA